MDSDSDSEEQQHDKFTVRGAVGRVLLIDVRNPQGLETPVRALDATRAVVRRELRAGTGGARLTSVCLYNARAGVRGVVELLPLAVSSLSSCRTLLAADATAHGQAAESELADALWHCGRVFGSCARALGERTVVLLARFDDPPPRNQQRPALKRAVDLANLGIELRLVNISQEPYEPDPFYVDLLQASCNGRAGWETAVPEPVWGVGDIESQLRRRSHRLAASARLRLHLGEGLNFAVAVYHLTSKQHPPKKVNLSRDRNEIVSSNITTLRVTAASASESIAGPSNGPVADGAPREIPLLKSEVLFYQCYGGVCIEFTGEELAGMKSAMGPQGIRLLGFKPRSWLAKEKWFWKECQFLFPDESAVEGSTRAFCALHRACTERSVVAVCMLRSRASSHPRVVALAPCARPLGLSVDVGFDIIHIPYLENVKDVPEPEAETPVIAGSEVELMKSVVEQLEFKYTPDTFENPNLQSLYRAIEALALEEESTEPFVDTTKPSLKKFEGIDSELFEEVFGPFEVNTAKKRAGTGAAPAAKRRMDDVSIDEELLRARLDGRQVHRYNVNDLRQLLRWKNPPNLKALTGMKKDELVQLVYQHCS